MDPYLLYFLAVAGITYIITQSFLFKKFRDMFYVGDFAYKELCKTITVPGYSVVAKWSTYLRFYIYELVSCPLCFGFWVGLVAYWIMFELAAQSVLYGFAASICCYFSFNLIDLMWSSRKTLRRSLEENATTTSSEEE